ncbi:MAG: class I SAM-dependent methyltransferase [Nitriliruptorales bacterium]
MQGSSQSGYGEHWADVYDAWVAEHIPAEETEQAVRTLAALARGGRALELGIGTGRLALPLADRGTPVEGIDASEAMIERLREKAGGGAIPVTHADFSDVAVKGEFALIFVAFNTFFALASQGEQVRCFRNVAQHLSDEGVFVIEAFVLFPTRPASRMARRCAPCA